MAIYYCKHDNNTCPKKESCRRYVHAENNDVATLFKYACTEDNEYLLFIKEITDEQNSDA